jgi:hypothetical protein
MLPIALLCLLLSLVSSQDPTLCPSDSGLVVTGRLIFQQTANATASSIFTDNTLTYNHTLLRPFSKQPGVTISTSHSTQASPASAARPHPS